MISNLSLTHVGPTDKLSIDFAPRVNLFTGDNGLGKSFLLDLVWWLLTNTWTQYPARPRDKGASLALTYQGIRQNMHLVSHFHWDEQEWITEPAHFSANSKTRQRGQVMMLYARADGGFATWDVARSRPLGYLFGPTQVWDGLTTQDPANPSRITWLCEGLIRDWASWQRERGAAFDLLCKVLETLSPRPEERLEPGALTRISLHDNRDMPTLKMPYGEEVAVVHASAAIRRIIALAYLLVWTWQEHLKASQLLRLEPADEIVLLVDELEAHLHPAWQRRILPALLSVVKLLNSSAQVQVQIIAVTHSPMVLASMEPHFDRARDALWLFDLVSEGDRREVKLHRDEWHRRGDASRWLRSEVFDLGEARSIEAERALREAEAFMSKDIPDAARFQTLYDDLRRSMPGDDPFWITWRGWAWRHGLLQERAP